MWYNFLVEGADLLLRMLAFFSPKVKKWCEGRAGWRQHFSKNFTKKGPVFWVHVASLGEFEQGRTLIEAFRAQQPNWQIVLTFFSPSGFEMRKNYPNADFVAYLPLDTPANVRDFLAIIQPDLAIFVKYEFWKNYLFALKKMNIPTVLVAAVFRTEQPFFKFYGTMWRKMLQCFDHVFVQDEFSKNLLQTIGIQNITIAGDTRIDRVLEIADSAQKFPLIDKFLFQQHYTTFIAGSSWEPDEAVYLPFFQRKNEKKYQVIIAPHEVKDLKRYEKLNQLVFYSQLAIAPSKSGNTLVIDNVGMLNALYRYGTIAYIGGGFGRGIHNILEPAAFGLPIIFGPNYHKFHEAHQLIAAGGAFSVKNQKEFAAVMERFSNTHFLTTAGKAARRWLLENRGATACILAYLTTKIKEKQVSFDSNE